MGKSRHIFPIKGMKFNIDKEIQASLKRECRELEKKAKKKEDLIIPVIFDVLEADYQTTPLNDDNGVMGQGFRTHMTGLYLSATFRVNPQDSSIPINQLKFKGFTYIKSGDKIRAHVPKYREEEEGAPTGITIGGREGHKRLYLERPFNSEEKVSKLELLLPDGKVLATFNGI